tara:strand:- start:750 stop:1208 length:459 start_codon:yes stop_codon:yes gene_type:complete
MLAVLMLAFGLNALAPAGYMIAAGAHGLPSVSICPETHPLARAVAASRERHEMADGMAMDHAEMDHATVDHATMDHAAMGHADDGDSAPTASNTGHCMLAGAAKLAVHSVDEQLLADEAAFAVMLGLQEIRPLALPAHPHLRPPLRGPPSAI